mmetsp:Transcript_4922/g.8028  ORF Transcript_4922/g.8028 Transcript_4922/m.8028 type:complete len:160 (-) Transcript_4922:213-692(-)
MQGLVDGRVLWDTMHAQTHPLGPKYHEVYDFLACEGISPCNGWLNSNETLRNITSEWAFSLNKQYQEIMQSSSESYGNFKLGYFQPDWFGMLRNYTLQYGAPATDLIEPSDGFHPSQVGNELLAQEIWQWLEAKFPESIGSVNPFNEEIKRIFGDQGGY